MKTFIPASSTKTRREKIDKAKVEKFINKFNYHILHDKECEIGDGSFHLNSSLDKIPLLNDNELRYAAKLAKHRGWELTQHEDNYQTTSYRMMKSKK